MDNSEKTLEKLVTLSKGRGFVYPGSEIYGGLANTWAVSYTHLTLPTNSRV